MNYVYTWQLSQPQTQTSDTNACFGGFLNHLLSAQKG